MSNFKLTLLAVSMMSQVALAQQIPDAGSQIQQIPPVPEQPRVPHRIVIEPVAPPVSPAVDTARIQVNSLRISGAGVYSEVELLAETGFIPGSQLTLTELRGMAAKIANHYRANGYFVAQAHIPPQEIQDGVVTINVMEGRYGRVSLQNQSRLSDAVAHRLLDGIESGDLIMAAPLENRLLLLSDLPGVNVKSTLVPGSAPGTSDLIVEVMPGKRISGSIDFDNAGNRYTGEYRLGANVNLNNPLGLGDVLSLRVLTSGSGLNYARIAYQMQVGKGTIGAAFSGLHYELGKEFAPLGASGEARIASLYGSYPLIRTRNNNVSARLNLEHKTFRDRVRTPMSVSDKVVDVATVSLVGDHRDTVGAGGVTGYSVAFSAGNLSLDTPGVRAFDALTARTQGEFGKLNLQAIRLQPLTENVSIYGAVRAQVASKNLDSSEKMGLGGMYGVRAYPEGEASADEGVLMTLEARLRLARLSEMWGGRVELIGFVDGGSVRINKNPWAAGANRRTLSGAGVGASWMVANNFFVRGYYARKLGNETALSAPDKSGRFFIQMVKYF